MNIRAAEESDIPAIVDLLKISLGEGLMPKSETYWRWKHLENPFGASPVLVAEDLDKIIGVRAFMNWEWTNGHDVLKAVRAVDTATHPAYQGMGIFKRLTLDLVNACKMNGVDFIYNTPNTQSRPGYLKMGWQVVDRMPVRFHIVNPLGRFVSGKVTSMPATNWLQQNDIVSLLETSNTMMALRTHYTAAYFKWRYGSVPVARYNVLHDTDNVVFYRLKANRWGTEMRVTDWLATRKNTGTMKRLIHDLAVKEGARLITFSGLVPNIKGGVVLRRGPYVTVRNLSFTRIDDLLHFKNWSPSLGDMELF